MFGGGTNNANTAANLNPNDATGTNRNNNFFSNNANPAAFTNAFSSNQHGGGFGVKSLLKPTAAPFFPSNQAKISSIPNPFATPAAPNAQDSFSSNKSELPSRAPNLASGGFGISNIVVSGGGFGSANGSISNSSGILASTSGGFNAPSTKINTPNSGFNTGSTGVFNSSAGGFNPTPAAFGVTAGGFASNNAGFGPTSGGSGSYLSPGGFASVKSLNNTPFGIKGDKLSNKNGTEKIQNAFAPRGILPFAAPGNAGNNSPFGIPDKLSTVITTDSNKVQNPFPQSQRGILPFAPQNKGISNFASSQSKDYPGFKPGIQAPINAQEHVKPQQPQQQQPQQQQQQKQPPQQQWPRVTEWNVPRGEQAKPNHADKEKELREMLQKSKQALMDKVAERDRMLLRITDVAAKSDIMDAANLPTNDVAGAAADVAQADDAMGTGDDDDDDAADDDNWLDPQDEDEDDDNADNSLNVSNTSDIRPTGFAPQVRSDPTHAPDPVPFPFQSNGPSVVPSVHQIPRPTQASETHASTSRGICEDFCPYQERKQRIEENDVHKLEYPPSVTNRDDLCPQETENSMVKKFQRSSADHELLIPHLLRTVGALYRTITYMEDNIMERHLVPPGSGIGALDRDKVTALFVYLFVWDRYRMVAKDFTLQISALEKSSVWVECHERMARWFVLMDHYMQGEHEFQGGHAQQNGEQLNNLLKTLDGYYNNSSLRSTPMPNKAEFIGYFILFQLGNGGEVTKYLQQVEEESLRGSQVQFALKVQAALKTDNYALFFKLLRSADLLQACLIHRYVGQVRLTAMKVMSRNVFKGAGGVSYYPLSDIIRSLMFEDEDDAMEFLFHCGFEMATDDPIEGPCVILTSQNMYDCFPVDKNGNPKPPVTNQMALGIDSKRTDNNWTMADVCRGKASHAVLYTPPSDITPRAPNTQMYEKRMAVRTESTKNSSVVTLNSLPEGSSSSGGGRGFGVGLDAMIGAGAGNSGGLSLSQQLQLQPSKKFLAPKPQPTNTPGFASPSPATLLGEGKKELLRTDDDDPDTVFKQLKAADNLRDKLLLEKHLEQQKNNLLLEKQIKEKEKEKLRIFQLKEIEKEKEKEVERERVKVLQMEKLKEIEVLKEREKAKELERMKEKEKQKEIEEEEKREIIRQQEREKTRLREIELENEKQRKLEQKRQEEKAADEAFQYQQKERKLEIICEKLFRKNTFLLKRKILKLWLDKKITRDKENKKKTVKLFFMIWRRLRKQRKSTRSRLITDMSNINISCVGPPRLGVKHKIHLPLNPHPGQAGTFKDLDTAKRRKINSFQMHNSISGIELSTFSDRLFNSSCSLFSAKSFMLESLYQDEDGHNQLNRQVARLFGNDSAPVIEGLPFSPPPKRAPSPSSASTTPQLYPSPVQTLDLNSIVSPSLFRTQSGAVRASYGFPDTAVIDPAPENGPLWGLNGLSRESGENGPELFFKLAVCTGSTARGVWCDGDSFAGNMLRSFLAVKGGAGKGSLCLTRKYVPCHTQRTGRVEMRYTSVSVVDVCGEDPSSLSGIDGDAVQGQGRSGKDAKEGWSGGRPGTLDSSTQGTQAVLIVLPSEGWTDSRSGTPLSATQALRSLCTALSSGVPVALIVTRETHTHHTHTQPIHTPDTSDTPSSSYTLAPSRLTTHLVRPLSMSWAEIPLGELVPTSHTQDNTNGKNTHNLNSSSSSSGSNVSSRENARVVYETMEFFTKLFDSKYPRSGFCGADLFQNLCGAYLYDIFVYKLDGNNDQNNTENGHATGHGCSAGADSERGGGLRMGSFASPYSSTPHTVSQTKTQYNEIVHKTFILKENEKIKIHAINQCVGCLSAAVQRLAECAAPLPILRRIQPFAWLGDEMFQRIKEDINRGQSHAQSSVYGGEGSVTDIACGLLDEFISMVNQSTNFCINSVYESVSKSMACTTPHALEGGGGKHGQTATEAFLSYPAPDFAINFNNPNSAHGTSHDQSNPNTSSGSRSGSGSSPGSIGGQVELYVPGALYSSSLSDDQKWEGGSGIQGLNLLPINWTDKDSYTAAASSLQRLLLPSATPFFSNLSRLSVKNSQNVPSNRSADECSDMTSESSDEVVAAVSRYFTDLGPAGWVVSQSCVVQLATSLHAAACGVKSSVGMREESWSSNTCITLRGDTPHNTHNTQWKRALWGIIRARIEAWPALTPVYIFPSGASYKPRGQFEALIVDGIQFRNFENSTEKKLKITEFLEAKDDVERSGRKRRNPGVGDGDDPCEASPSVQPNFTMTEENFLLEFNEIGDKIISKRMKEEVIDHGIKLYEVLGSMDEERNAADRLLRTLENAMKSTDFISPMKITNLTCNINGVKSDRLYSARTMVKNDEEINFFLMSSREEKLKYENLSELANKVLNQQYIQK